ncbi:DEP domain-containing mTOR-interacting protein [Seminavis robusta]|uniref:DEP domain-containing mTOR-interacting protein n=1 Tax=Seminavis robusta TaxID=568900 RepID=A0A9N8DKX6_9STRA|nr:DEP domain-containing mTOR-interacting protein [Seminavis robusta]|eukprot:Sro215_g089030.1 DEP domain-containing mTOR-interacting protein (253) ;mRNA; f:42034-42792
MPKSSTTDLVSRLVDDLESLAMDFQVAMHERGLVKDRKFGLITYPDAFVGRDAVGVLVDVLYEMHEEEEDISRQSALMVGRAMAEHLELFESAFRLKAMDHELSDDKYHYYHWKNNVPSDVAQTTWEMSLMDKVKVLKKYVRIQDRYYRLKMYPRCFTGTEAVDVLMKQRIVVSRRDAVKLIRKMKREYGCFFNVTDKNQPFEDGFYFYRFKYDEDLMQKGVNKAAFDAVMDALTGNEGMTTEFRLTSESFH